MTYTPYPETETTAYRFTGTYLRLPTDERIELEDGDEVELPDRVAGPIDDLLEPVDGTDENRDQPAADDGSSGEDTGDQAGEEPETEGDQEDGDVDHGGGLTDVESVETPDDFPETVPDAEAWEWQALREVSGANDVNASQSKEEQVEDLRAIAAE